MTHTLNHAKHSQQGVALMTVLIVVALIALIGTQMTSTLLLQQRRSSNILQSDQAFQYVLGAEALARARLSETLKDSPDRVYLGQKWVGKKTFPIEGGYLAGEIEDMSTCFNVNAIFAPKKKLPTGTQPPPEPTTPAGSTPESKAPPGEQILQKLYEQVVPTADSSPQALVATLRDWIDNDSDVYGSDGAEDYEYMGYEIPYRTGNSMLGAVSEIRTIKGYTPEIYAKLRPFLCALPDREYSSININTLPVERAELLAALMDHMPVETAKQLLSDRPKDGWANLDAFMQSNGMPTDAVVSKVATGRVTFTTSYFLVHAEAVVGKGNARVESLLKRAEDKSFTVVSRSFAEE